MIENHIFFLSDFDNNPNTKPQTIAVVRPAATALIPPAIAPIKPFSATPSSAPFARFEPKPIMGIVTPDPANCFIGSNAPVTSNTTPTSNYNTRIRADDIVVLFISI